jgi:hypothetical protein
LTNIPELAIIRYILIYNNYIEYYKYINIIYIRNSYKELSLIYDALVTFFARNPRDTSLAELQVFFHSLHPNYGDKERAIYDGIFREIEQSNVPDSSTLDLVKSIRQRERLQTLAVKAFDASEGRSSVQDVKALAEILESVPEDTLTEVNFVTDNLEDLYVEAVKTPGLRWRLPSLNKSLGSLRKGDFGFIFARPETGKTTFLASECSYMATLGISGPIIWFNNEEQGSKVMLRCYQAALGLRLEQLISNIKTNHQEFLKLTKGNIKIYDQAIITKQDAETICQRLQPSLIIFDQIDKISGFKADRNDLELGAIYNWARELAKCYAPVIGICQADGTGDGQKWLTMGNVANAKTSKQAEADWILGIGATYEAGYEGVRHFNISKNKLFGDTDSVPEMRHYKWDVKFLPDVARYEDFLEDN